MTLLTKGREPWETKYALALKETFDSIYLSKQNPPPQKRFFVYLSTNSNKQKNRIPPGKKRKKDIALFSKGNKKKHPSGSGGIGRREKNPKPTLIKIKINRPAAKNNEKQTPKKKPPYRLLNQGPGM